MSLTMVLVVMAMRPPGGKGASGGGKGVSGGGKPRPSGAEESCTGCALLLFAPAYGPLQPVPFDVFSQGLVEMLLDPASSQVTGQGRDAYLLINDGYLKK